MSKSMRLDGVRFRELRLFDRVVALGTISGAARELGVPKATASRWLAQLELEIGETLVLRSTRRLALTPQGEALHQQVQMLLRSAWVAEANVTASALAGRLKLAIPVLPGQAVLGRVLPRFRRELPQVALTVVIQNARVDLLRDGFDAAVVAGRLPDSPLLFRRLASARVRIYASAALEGQSPESMPWLATPADVNDLPPKVPFLRTPSAIVNDRQVIGDAVVRGGGLAMLPTAFGEPAVDRGELIRVVAAPELPDTVVHAIYARRLREDPRLEVLIDLLAEALAEVFAV